MHAHTKRILVDKNDELSNEDYYKLYIDTGEQKYLDIIVNNWIPKMMGMARAIAPENVDPNDLVQEGVIGFIRGIKKYDISKGFKISTYCLIWARKYMFEHREQLLSTIRQPATQKKKTSILDKEFEEFDFYSELNNSHHEGRCIDLDGDGHDKNDSEYIESIAFNEDVLPILLKCLTPLYGEALINYVNKKSTCSKKITKLKLHHAIRNRLYKINRMTTFIEELEQNMSVIISKNEYEYWMTGKRQKYRGTQFAPIAYQMQKALFGFNEKKLPNGTVLLYY